MRPGLCHLFPLRPAPRATRLGGEHREVREGFPPPQRPPHPRAPPRDGLWPGSLSWAAPEHPPPPTPTPVREARVCACVCSGCVWGGAVSPLTPETWDLSEPGSRGWGPSPFVAKGRWIFPHTSQPRSSGDLCTPKSPTVPLIPFLPQSFFSEALPDFPVRFTASLHCS